MTARTFFTSDLHFGHRLVAGKRGFGTVTEEWQTADVTGEVRLARVTHVTPEQVEEHDEAIIENWNTVIRPWADVEVWVLGDLTLRDPGLVWDKVDRLRGTKHLVLGNHDAAWPGHRGAHRHLREYLEHFETVTSFASIRMEGQQIVLAHCPYSGDRGPEREQQWRLRDVGNTIIHGHTHSPERLSRTERGTLQVHAGLDAWKLRPVHGAEVMRLIRENTEAAA